MRAGEQRERDREVEPRSLLPQRRRREVDGDPVAHGPRQHRVDDAAVNPVFRLLTGSISETDDRKRREIGRDEVRLDIDPTRLEPDHGAGKGPGQHSFDGTTKRVPCLGRFRTGTVSAIRGGRARAPSASRGDEDRLVVLAGTPPCAPIHVALMTVDEAKTCAPQNLGIEVASVIDDDAHPRTECER